MHVTIFYFQPLRVLAFGQNKFIMTKKNKCNHGGVFFLLLFFFSPKFALRKGQGLSSGSEFGIFRLTYLSQKQQNTSLSEVIAAKINSLQAVGISIDNKVDGLDARVAILESSGGNTDRNIEWLEGMVKKKVRQRMSSPAFLTIPSKTEGSLNFGGKT